MMHTRNQTPQHCGGLTETLGAEDDREGEVNDVAHDRPLQERIPTVLGMPTLLSLLSLLIASSSAQAQPSPERGR